MFDPCDPSPPDQHVGHLIQGQEGHATSYDLIDPVVDLFLFSLVQRLEATFKQGFYTAVAEAAQVGFAP